MNDRSSAYLISSSAKISSDLERSASLRFASFVIVLRSFSLSPFRFGSTLSSTIFRICGHQPFLCFLVFFYATSNYGGSDANSIQNKVSTHFDLADFTN